MEVVFCSLKYIDKMTGGGIGNFEIGKSIQK